MDNAAISELLIREAETADGHREPAFRRTAHNAFMWPDEVGDLVAAGRALRELAGIGPSLSRRLQGWLELPPKDVEPPPERQEFLTLTQARKILAKHPEWTAKLQGDLQMHTEWSDGSASIRDMVASAVERGYRYIGITDHTKGLEIARGLDEGALKEQGREIHGLNSKSLAALKGTEFTVLRGDRNESLDYRQGTWNLLHSQRRSAARAVSL